MKTTTVIDRISTIAIADPKGQSRESRNCWPIRLPAKIVLSPPRITGFRYSPISGMNTSSEPATMPGAASGRVIRRNARRGLSPRSSAASTSDQSSRSSAAYSGRIMSGRYV